MKSSDCSEIPLRSSALTDVFQRRLSVVAADPDDNRILEAALSAEADAIVSGDTHLLDLVNCNGIPVISADTFLKKFT